MRRGARNKSGLLQPRIRDAVERVGRRRADAAKASGPASHAVESGSVFVHTGWYDCPLSEKGHEEATEAGRLVAAEGFKFDVAFTSTLKRAIRTLDHALEETDHMWIPVTKAW